MHWPIYISQPKIEKQIYCWSQFCLSRLLCTNWHYITKVLIYNKVPWDMQKKSERGFIFHCPNRCNGVFHNIIFLPNLYNVCIKLLQTAVWLKSDDNFMLHFWSLFKKRFCSCTEPHLASSSKIHLEFCVQFWFQYQRKFLLWWKFNKHSSKWFVWCQDMHQEWLAQLGLYSPEFRRMRGYLIKAYIILIGPERIHTGKIFLVVQSWRAGFTMWQ